MNRPMLGLAAVLMLSGISIAQAQEGPGDKMQGPAHGVDRGAAGPVGGDDHRGAGPRGGDRARRSEPSRAREDGSGPQREKLNRADDGAPDGRKGASRAERSGDEPKARKHEKTADDAKGPDRKAQAETKDKASDKSAKSDADRGAASKSKEGKSAAEADKAKPADTSKQGDTARGEAASKSREGKSAAEADKAKPADTGKQGDTARGEASKSKEDKGAAEADKAKPADAAKQAEGDRKPAEEVKKADLSGDRRERVRSAFRETRDVKRHDKVDIDISIGTRLPRDWGFALVPVAVVAVVPEYRGYVYVYAEDEYVICDPVTYEVVAVLPAPDGPRYARGGGGTVAADRCSTSLVLSNDDRDFILRSVEMTDEAKVANVTVGWSVPSDIELRTFPEPILSRNGDLAACRYFVVDEEVAIVDPREEKVILLVEHE